MKIKTLLVCFLAVCTLSLTSCKKNKDYTENFVGSYELTMTPNLELSVVSDIPGMEDMLDINDIGAIEPIEGVLCNISKVGDDNDVNVTLSYEEDGQIVPIFVLSGTCDEVGLNLKSSTINQALTVEETGIFEMNINLTVGSSTIAAPVNGKISWTSGLNGAINLEIPTEMGINVPVSLNITGNLDIVGTKK